MSEPEQQELQQLWREEFSLENDFLASVDNDDDDCDRKYALLMRAIAKREAAEKELKKQQARTPKVTLTDKGFTYFDGKHQVTRSVPEELKDDADKVLSWQRSALLWIQAELAARGKEAPEIYDRRTKKRDQQG